MYEGYAATAKSPKRRTEIQSASFTHLTEIALRGLS